MKRRLFVFGLVTTAAMAVTGGAALAASFSEDVVAQLVKLGFSDITAETTLLGRVRITAHRADGVREIVLNPRTGEVLRDIWMPTATGGTARTVLSDVADDDGDDAAKGDDNGGDRGDDDAGDDNSGKGGGDDHNDDRDGNSGRGGGGRDDKKDD